MQTIPSASAKRDPRIKLPDNVVMREEEIIPLLEQSIDGFNENKKKAISAAEAFTKIQEKIKNFS